MTKCHMRLTQVFTERLMMTYKSPAVDLLVGYANQNSVMRNALRHNKLGNF